MSLIVKKIKKGKKEKREYNKKIKNQGFPPFLALARTRTSGSQSPIFSSMTKWTYRLDMICPADFLRFDQHLSIPVTIS